MSTDTRLARRASEGDERAFAAIFRRYHQDLYRYCLAILRSPEDAHDALQNTMVSALRALPGESREIELKPWLYRIAHNESIDLVRRRRASEPLDPELTAAGPGLAQEAAARERLGRLLADLEQLPERQRGALLMRELGGLGFEEIGSALGCSAAVARQTTYEARLGLREFEAGREMDCVAITKLLSDADGRVARRRDVRAHLRDCPSCTAFQAEIRGRRRDLAALSPLPAVLGAGLLQGILGGGGAAAGGGGLGGALGAGAVKSALGSVALKATATVVVLAALGAGAERGNLVDVGLPGTGGKSPPPTRTPAAAEVESVAGETPAPAAARDPASQGGGRERGREVAIADAAASAPAAARAAEQPDAASTETSPEPATSGSAAAKGRSHGARAALPEAAQKGQQTAAAHKGAAHGRSAEHPASPAPAGVPVKPAKPDKPASAKGPPADPGNGGEPPPAAEKPVPAGGNGKQPPAAPAE